MYKHTKPEPDLSVWRSLGRIIIRSPYPPSNAIIYMHFYE